MTSMRTIVIASLAALLFPGLAVADPPAHAPAYGRRAKEAPPVRKQHRPSHGVEIRLDPTRGIYVAVGLPGVYFEGGSYYRHTDAGWQISATGHDGWSIAAVGSVPAIVLKVHPAPPASPRMYRREHRREHYREREREHEHEHEHDD